MLALLGAHHFFHVSRIRVKPLTLRLLMSYIYIYKSKAIPLQAWTGPEGSRRLRLPDFKTVGT